MKTLALSALLVTFAFLSVSQIPSYVPTSDLVAWYPFSGNSNDASGNGHNGTLNGPTTTTDRFNNSSAAYNFDGTNDYIFIPSSGGFDAMTSLSVSAWYHTTTTTSARTIMTHSDPATAAGERYTMRLNLARIKNASTCAGGIWNGTGNHPYNTNQWTHYVFTFNQAMLYVYVDGSLVDSADVPNGALGPCTNAPLKIGLHWNSDPQWFLGKLDDIGIWDRALTYNEISALYGAINDSLTQVDTIICSTDTIALSCSGNSSNYTWSTGATSSTINVSPDTNTLYFVTISNAFDSLVDSVFIEVSNMSIDTVVEPPTCFDALDGSISIIYG